MTYRTVYESIVNLKEHGCVGSYAFLWGYKQQKTPTWVSLLNLYQPSFPDSALYGKLAGRLGEESDVLGELHRCWDSETNSCDGGVYSESRAPMISDMVITLQVSRPGGVPGRGPPCRPSHQAGLLTHVRHRPSRRATTRRTWSTAPATVRTSRLSTAASWSARRPSTPTARSSTISGSSCPSPPRSATASRSSRTSSRRPRAL